jgi:hypothetical protein
LSRELDRGGGSQRRAAHDPTQAALGNRLAAELYGAHIVRRGRRRRARQRHALRLAGPTARASELRGFFERGERQDLDRLLGRRRRVGGLARQLPRRAVGARDQPDADRVAAAAVGLGHYMFFADLEGASDAPLAAAIDGLRGRCQEVRVLGSYRAP